MKRNFMLFLIMLKIGLFTFGGGYAMIPLIENEFVTKRQCLNNDEFVNMIAIAESTPGPIAINMATFIGYKQGKFIGALMSTLGVILPSFIIISIITLILDKFMEIFLISAAFKGIQSCVVFLILLAGIKMLKKLNKSIFNYIMFFIVFGCVIIFSLFSINFSTIYYILIAGFLALILNLILTHRKKVNKGEKQ